MRKCVCMLLVLVLCLGLCACGGGEAVDQETAAPETTVPETTVPETTVPETTVPETTAPTPDNSLLALADNFDDNALSLLVEWQNSSQNYGSFTVQDGWVYGMGTDETGRNLAFVKCRTDFSDKIVLEKGWVYFPFVRDGYVYYVYEAFDNGGEKGVYRMRISGEGREKLSDMHGSLQLWGDTLYVTYENAEDEAEKNCLYAMDLDGSNVRKVIERPVFHWFVFGNTILYQDDQDNESLHLADFEGNDIKLNDDISYYPIFDGEHIYYVKNIDEVRSIWRVDVDGQNDVKIADYHASNGFVLHKDKIYFVYQDDSHRIYSINKDGSGLALISQDDYCGDLQFIGDLLKYTDWRIQGNVRYVSAILLCDEDGSKLVDFGEIK